MERNLYGHSWRLSRVCRTFDQLFSQQLRSNHELPALSSFLCSADASSSNPVFEPSQTMLVSPIPSCHNPLPLVPASVQPAHIAFGWPTLSSNFHSSAGAAHVHQSTGASTENDSRSPISEKSATTSGRETAGPDPLKPMETGPHKTGERKASSIDGSEVAKFAAMADSWWDYRGDFAPLHKMNPVRCSFIRSALCHHFGRDARDPQPLLGLTILDVGCGGGLLCEPLARMGATVTGVDATAVNVEVARVHAAKDPATAAIEYRATTAETLVEEGRQFDAVMALEVVEHVADPLGFCHSLGQLCRTGGGLFMSTINRTPRAYALAIGAAEYILRWVPRGTHDWSRFVTPEELALALNRAALEVEELAGMVYNPLTRSWSLAEDTGVNYILFARKFS